MTRSILFSTLAVLILTSCTLVADLPGQVAANVADAPTQTSPADTSSSIPVPTPVPVNPSAQKTYQSAALGVQFRYPDSWHLQEFTEGQPASVIVTSFDLSNPPHKLEWTDQT